MDASTTLLYGIIPLHLFCWFNNWYGRFTKIKQEGQPAVDAWLETLKAGGSQSPIELAKLQELILLLMHHLKLLLNISLI